MPRKTKRRKSKRNLKNHVKHKTRLASLFVIKILLAFLSLGIALIIFSLIQNSLGLIFSGIIAFVIASVLYLVLIIRVLDALNF